MVNVPADGNCCLYVAQRWLSQNKGIGITNINKFRKGLKEHMIENEEAIRSAAHGVERLYTDSFWNEMKDRVYIEDKNYIEGCGRSGWVAMVDIYAVLVHKYGKFNLIVLSGEGKPYLYDMKNFTKSLPKGLSKKKWIECFLKPTKMFLKNTMICYFDNDHYQEIVKK